MHLSETLLPSWKEEEEYEDEASLNSVTKTMKIMVRKKFRLFLHFLETFSQADLLLPVFPHTTLCMFL